MATNEEDLFGDLEAAQVLTDPMQGDIPYGEAGPYEDDPWASAFGVNKSIAYHVLDDFPGTMEEGTSTAPPMRTVLGVLSMFYRMGPESLATMQEQMFNRGFYSSTYYRRNNPNQPAWGVPDEDSYKAYKSFVLQTVRTKLASQVFAEEQTYGVTKDVEAQQERADSEQRQIEAQTPPPAEPEKKPVAKPRPVSRAF